MVQLIQPYMDLFICLKPYLAFLMEGGCHDDRADAGEKEGTGIYK